ncbi:Ig-like domain-containing protein [Noviherbaspirillum sp. L7-7A]|uniref:Ig-like domain-containing protein n=1 Tax=Noviherbaspirillum sp. L7-7A TaxID=2850560 RepID=UPI001C2C8EB9|nr:Ig-like domain-containing protein [Noviherbaspirillum sp. L7-7A]MBV0881361.1 Ig-like domain-containing protein [Noviherbaspirillum sp. L7-7A]
MLKNTGRRMASAVVLLALPLTVLADGVAIRYDLSDPAGSPFPSDRFTVADPDQNTGRRVALPLPNCTIRPSDCADIRVLNTLDGFSTQPRITLPFNGDIDPRTVNSNTIFLMNLGDTLNGAGAGQKVGINQVVWDPASKTLAFESDELLNEHSRYVLLVTDGVRDASGKKLKSIDMDNDDSDQRRETSEYRRELRDALRSRIPANLKVAAATLFSTQSISTDLYKIMQSVKSAKPTASFIIGNNGNARAVFPVAGTTISFKRQTGATSFATSQLPVTALQVVPGAVGHIAYGTFNSPSYLNDAKYISPTPTRTGQPVPQRNEKLVFQLFLPSGAKPANGYPVAIFGHGFTDSMYGAPWTVASTFAAKGIATLAIQVVGHGGGEQGTLTVTSGGNTVTVPAGGRGYDQNGDGAIESTEGVNAAPPYTVLGSRDGLRQTVVDLMQLVSVVDNGMDVDGDGKADLDRQRIYYAGQSFGGIYGTILLGVEPRIKAGVPNVPGGSITEVARLGGFRPLTGIALASRLPSLINLPPAGGINFDENIPLRNLPPVVNNVPGAMAIQQLLDRNEWAQQAGNPVSYAPFIRSHPLPGNSAKPVLIQFARGDQTVPNPTTTAILRAGKLANAAVQYRNDLAYKANPAVPKNPHTFLTNIANPAAAAFAIGAQQQIAEFFISNGVTVIDPDGMGDIFEVPSKDLPETLNFIP